MALYLLLAPVVSFAGQVSIDAFSDAAVIQDFEVLGQAGAEYLAPITIGSDIFSADGQEKGTFYFF